MNRLKKGDKVIVISGRDRGKNGEIMRLLSNGKAVVNNINVAKKHTKPNPQTGSSGGIVQRELPIDVSNLALLNPATNKADKVRIVGNGKDKHRVFKSDAKRIDAE